MDDLLRFINGLIDEEAPIAMNKKITREEEAAWLEKELSSLKRGESIELVAEVDGRVVAHGGIRRHGFRESHVGTLGMGVSKGYRDAGIGTALLTALLEKARDAGLRLIDLEVFAGNGRAIHVYRKAGFRMAGRYPGKVSYKSRYVDVVLMVREIEGRPAAAARP